MDHKLTLSLDKSIIEQAKNYAKLNNISLSKLIESYLKSLTERQNKPLEITPLVESLSGIIQLDENDDIRTNYRDYLNRKHE